MNRTTRIGSDHLNMWPEHDTEHIRSRAAQASPQAAQHHAAARSHPARIAGGTVQALRSTGVSLCRRARPWTKGLSVGQRVRTAASDGLRAERQGRRGARAGRQLQHGTRHLDRSLRHQHGTSPSPRGVGLNGSGHRCVRFRQGGPIIASMVESYLAANASQTCDQPSALPARRAAGALPARIASGALPARRQGASR